MIRQRRLMALEERASAMDGYYEDLPDEDSAVMLLLAGYEGDDEWLDELFGEGVEDEF